MLLGAFPPLASLRSFEVPKRDVENLADYRYCGGTPPDSSAANRDTTIHLDGGHKGLFISKPVIGRASGKWSIQISRRVETDDGRFLGVAVFSLLPGSLTNLHHSVD